MKQKNMVLMVVAVGCGLVAAFLTSQMSGKSAQVEQVEVLVAAKDIPVGTQMNRDDLKTMVKKKKMPKDGLPPSFVVDENMLVDKRLARPVRAEETFNPGDLSTGGVVTIPAGMHMSTLQLGVPAAVAGFVGPGARVDVLVTIRLGGATKAFPLLVNMLILAVDTQVAYDKTGTFPQLNSVSFAVDLKQALLLELAKSRGCTITLMLRNPEDKSLPAGYDIDKVTAMLSDDVNNATVNSPGNGEGPIKGKSPPKSDKTDKTDKVEGTPETTPAPTPTPKALTVTVPVATEDIAANTELTKDLIAEKFKTIELPAHLAEGAFTDLTPALGKAFRTGLAKNQWVTAALVGVQATKPPPQDEFAAPKAIPTEPKPAATAQAPTTPAETKPVQPVAAAPKRAIKDIPLTTPHGVTNFRYEEYAPGKWRYLGEYPAGSTPEEPGAKPAKNRTID